MAVEQKQKHKPCPLCGAEGVIAYHQHDDKGQIIVAVGCKKCCLWIDRMPFNSVEEMLAVWNKRTPIASPAVPIAKPVHVFIKSIDDPKLKPCLN